MEEFAFETIDEFSNAVAAMSGGELRDLLDAHPDNVEYAGSRNAIRLNSCSGSLLALLPLTPEQTIGLE